MADLSFPRGFLFGVATSAYQIEGACDTDGRGESIWDRFCSQAGAVVDGSSGEPACDHYHRFMDDLDLMVQLGVNAYRFSIAWPRILPEGDGAVNRAGLDFYRRLVEGLRERRVEPLVTLYHWDLPQALEDRGGWRNRDTALRFADYAAVVAEELGGAVPAWITHNEPWCTSFLGYGSGLKAPGVRDWAAAVRASHHVLLSHGLAAQALRAHAPDSKVGLGLNLYAIHPASADPADVEAARVADGFQNRWFLDPVLRGRYPADMLAAFEARVGARDYVRAGDEELIGQPVDFLGVNFYSCHRVRANPAARPLGFETLPPRGELTAMGWEVAPEGLYDLLLRLRAEYGPVPIRVTENGAAYEDLVTNGVVEDPKRVEFVRRHLEALSRAIAAGVDVRGYYVWSLLDNFEWEHGYRKRFGIVYVDYATQRRIPKRSALWYRDVIAESASRAQQPRRANRRR
jgi:beta-glucosidase